MSAGVIRLSAQQLRAFIDDDLGGGGPCHLNETLPPAELASTCVVPNARLFLSDLDGGGAKLTGASRPWGY